MPRNSSGVYTLPDSNPVVPDTFIETDWANPTLADIAQALSDSLDRNGRGNMLAPFKFTDGSEAAPSISFGSEPTSGFYRPANRVVAVAISGAEVARWTDTAYTLQTPVLLPDGTLAAPALAFEAQMNTGLYRPGPNELGVAVAGVESARFTVAGSRLALQDGTAAAPSLAFQNELSTGIYRPGAGMMALTVLGVNAAHVDSGGLRIGNGSAAAPMFSFAAEPTTGLFRGSPGIMSVAVQGTEVIRFQPAVVYMLKNAVMNTPNPVFVMTKGASGESVTIYGSTGGIGRWGLLLGDTAGETGANAGSNFALQRIADGGAPIDNPIAVTRADGRVLMNLLSVAGGSAAAPAYTFLGNYNTGLFLPSAGVVGIAAAGVEAVRFSTASVFNVPIYVAGGAPEIHLDRPVFTTEANVFGSLNGVNRWRMTFGDSATETGANAGSNFSIVRFNDAGAILGVPFAINRATGDSSFTGSVAVSGNVRAVAGLYVGNDFSFGLFTQGAFRVLGFAGAWALKWDSAQGNLTYRNNSDAILYGLQADGNFTVNLGAGYQPGGGAWGTLSDARIKRDVVDYTQGLAQVLALRPRRFHYNEASGYNTEKEYVGLVAQEVQPVMPEMISEQEGNGQGPRTVLAMNTTALTYALVNSVKELATLVEALDFRLTNIEGALH